MTIELRGTVCDGQGAAAGFTQLDWVREQFRTKLGFDPFPGTLNLHIENPTVLESVRNSPGIPITPNTVDACPARAWHVLVGGQVAAAWILPNVPGYPHDILELMAPVSLRGTLGLWTGDSVTVHFLER